MNYSLLAFEPNGFNLKKSIIPKKEILFGGVQKDSIPALTIPNLIDSRDAQYLKNSDLILGVKLGDESVAYPLKILIWHEVINDFIGSTPILVSYCPLCNSAFVFKRKIKDTVFEFGVSGLLWKSNVLMYNKKNKLITSQDLWSQVLMKAVTGESAEKGLTLEAIPSQLVNWKSWKNKNPRSKVLSLNTNFKRNYELNPYKSYLQSSNKKLMFFPDVKDSKQTISRYGNKERILLIKSNNEIKAFPLSELKAAAMKTKNKVIKDTVGGKNFLITYDKSAHTASVECLDKATFATANIFWFSLKTMDISFNLFTEKNHS